MSEIKEEKEIQITYSIHPHTPDCRAVLKINEDGIFESIIIGVELEDSITEIEERLNKCIN